MPWSTQANHPDCPSDESWGVVNEESGELEGCHATEDDANRQVAALYAQEIDEEGAAATDEVLAKVYATVGARNESGVVEGVEITTLADEQPVYADSDTFDEGRWEGILHVEEVETGDWPRRLFREGALSWREFPLPIRWKEFDSEGHENAVQVGSVDEGWRDGRRLRARGRFNMNDETTRRVYDLLRQGMLRGVSIGVDDVTDADVELVFPESPDDPEDDEMLMELFAEPEKAIFHKARIMEATIVNTPAQQEAFVWLVPDEAPVETVETVEPDTAAAADTAAAFGAIGSHESGTSDDPWDGPANEARLASPMAVATARNAYAWMDTSEIEDGEITKSACKFIHHNVSSEGRPGAANLTACSTGIGVLNGGRGGSTIPPDDRQGVYNHLARHLRDGGREPPELLSIETFAAAVEFAEATEREPSTGVAVVARVEDPGSFTVAGGLPADEMHVTLGFFGHVDDDGMADKIDLLKLWVEEQAAVPIEAAVNGIARMGNDDPQAVTYLIESADLAELRQSLEAVVEPDRTHPHFTPHVTLGYGVDLPDSTPELVRLGGLEVWAGEEHFDRSGPITAGSTATASKPPGEWFANPRLSGPTPLTFSDDGRIYGHLAVFGTCHTAYANACVTPPRAPNGDYGYFTTGVIETADGKMRPVGQITVGTNHAPNAAGAQPAAAHYEHTGHAVADVAVGEDRTGIWVAGAVRPGLAPAMMRAVRGAALSGDWRVVRGQYRLVAALAVNVPGFPVPRLNAFVHDGEQTALVAAGIVRPGVDRPPRVASSVIDTIAASIGRDRAARAAELRQQARDLVHPS